MTLRGRLTTAFLAVVLGPVLLGSLFVGITVSTVTRDRTVERLDRAASAARLAVGALCGQLQAVADAIAVLPESSRVAAAEQLVARGIASGVQVADAAGAPLFTTPGLPVPLDAGPLGVGPRGAGPLDAGPRGVGPLDAGPRGVGPGSAGGRAWRQCARPDPATAVFAARAETRDPHGRPLGTVYAVQALDGAFIDRLAATTGTAVTLLSGPGTGVSYSTEPPGSWSEITASGGDAVARTADGSRYVRRLSPTEGQPLPLVLSVPGRDPVRLYDLLLISVLGVALVTIVAAGWLARSTTQPLVELAAAAHRVAGGELDTRVPVLRDDELGRLGSAFNRMTRELQAYVQALTASRDQLRGHLAILGDTLSSTHDLHRIMQVILRTAMSATGARAGVVLLTDETDGALVARSAERLTGRWAVPDDELGTLRVPPGEGVLGAVAATGEPRRGNASRDPLYAVPDEPPCVTYVAVPICAPLGVGDPLVPGRPAPDPGTAAALPATLGVLALYDRLGADEFDDADLRTLRTFAGQAGVAVNNVRVHEEAQRLSLTDPLTGLWNYRYLRESVRREVERASRFSRMLTVLALDLDHFKKVNDTYGHAAGDAVLHEFAHRIRIGLREVDLAFRQGGEEFVVLLPETDAYGGAIVAERLNAAVRDIAIPVDARHGQDGAGAAVDHILVSVSIGIAVFPDHGTTAQQVLDAADDALYAAKAAGRDTYRSAVSASTPARPDMIMPTIADSAWNGGPQGTPVSPTSPAASLSGGAPGGPHPPRQSRGR